MGVHGLWRLLEPSGKPVPLESLQNKILAIDISIWLHQAVKGYKDGRGAPVVNAHLLCIYHRLCKLLYFRIRPVFVFDGGVPILKRQTIIDRNQRKHRLLDDADQVRKKLVSTLVKHAALKKVIEEKSGQTTDIPDPKDDMFKLPPKPASDAEESSNEETEESEDEAEGVPHKKHRWDFNTIDEKSDQFRSLPADVRHEILTEVKETRKQNSWNRIHEMPTQSDGFAGYQMKRLLKRHSVQLSLEEAEKEMGGRSLSLAELEEMLSEEGVISKSKDIGQRIASDANTRFLLIKDLKKAPEVPQEAEKKAEPKVDEKAEPKVEEKSEQKAEQKEEETEPSPGESSKYLEYESDMKLAIQLSLQEEPSTSKAAEEPIDLLDSDEELQAAIALSLSGNVSPKKRKSPVKQGKESVKNFLRVRDHGEKQENREIMERLQNMDSAVGYMLASGLTQKEIKKIIKGGKKEQKEEEKSDIYTDFGFPLEYEEKAVAESDSEDEGRLQAFFSVAKSYMTEYSDLTPSEIAKIIGDSGSKIKTKQKIKLDLPEATKEALWLQAVSQKDSEADPAEEEALKAAAPETKVEIEPEVVKKAETAEISDSESSDSDFVDVDKIEKPETEAELKPKLEILINPSNAVDDDLFSDIFSETPQKMPSVPKLSPEISSEPSIKADVEITPKPAAEEIVPELIKEPEKQPSLLKKPSPEPEEPIVQADRNETVKEMLAKEYHREVKVKGDEPMLSTDQLREMESNLGQEREDLMAEQTHKERIAGSITDQMYQDAQELLQLFGVPYVIAPMEAEAQCAFFEEINLTDGTITDDSDIWLFGGRTVYKNFFNQQKFVLEYRSDSIQQYFKLSRQQMVLLALLVGSDYTIGIPGIGPVTALEIIASFPPAKKELEGLSVPDLVSGLKSFKNWLSGGGGSRSNTILRSKLQNIRVADGFPSQQVVQAYLDPKVETCSERFSWAPPDTVGLVDFAREKFGWTRHKTEEILKPVLKKLEEKQTQRLIGSFFGRVGTAGDVAAAEGKMSDRVKRAIHRIAEEDEEPPPEDVTKTAKEPAKKRKSSAKQSKPKISKPSGETSAGDPPNRPESSKQNSETSGEGPPNRPQSSAQSGETPAEAAPKAGRRRRFVPRDPEEQRRRDVLNVSAKLHAKEVIPQRERDKQSMLKNRLKAIETFRRSKRGPGYVQKRARAVRELKEDAGLSETSSSDE